MSSWKVHLTVLGMLVALVAAVSFVDLTRDERAAQGVIAWFVAMGFVLYAAVTTGVVAIFRLELKTVVAVHLVPVSVAMAVAGAWYSKQRPQAPVAVAATPPRVVAAERPLPIVLRKEAPPQEPAVVFRQASVSLGNVSFDAKVLEGTALVTFLHSRKSAFESCIQLDTTTTGSATLHFKITPEGQPASIELTKNSLENQRAKSCLTIAMRNWVFPFNPPTETPVTVLLQYQEKKLSGLIKCGADVPDGGLL